MTQSKNVLINVLYNFAVDEKILHQIPKSRNSIFKKVQILKKKRILGIFWKIGYFVALNVLIILNKNLKLCF